jgi:hypothetical protein
MAVARDDLGGDRFSNEAQLFADIFLDARVDIGKGADSAGNCAGGDFCAGGNQTVTVAAHLGIETGKGQAHRGRLGMNAVAAADADGILVFEGTGLQRIEHAIQIGK